LQFLNSFLFIGYSGKSGLIISSAGGYLSLMAKFVELGGRVVYKIDYSTVDEKPAIKFKCMKELVDLGRFELPTPWLQTIVSHRYEWWLSTTKMQN